MTARVLGILCLILALSGCADELAPELPTYSDAPSDEVNVYRFGIHPLHNPGRLHEIFGPLMEYLSSEIKGVEFRLEASLNYAAYDVKLARGEFHFSLPNPYQTVVSLEHGYRVFGKMGDDENFRGIILVRKDSGIKEVEDLKGKAVSYPAPTALAATMMPQYFLFQRGLDVVNDLENLYVGSQESSIMNVYVGHTAAGASWLPPWRALVKERPQLADELEIKWQTQSLPNNGLVARQDIPQSIVDQVAALLFKLHTHDQGRQILQRMELSRFEPASDATYQSVREFIQVFTEKVREPAAEL